MIESVSRRAFSGSSGTYNVRASELARDRRLKTLSATVIFLDDTQHVFQIDKRAKGHVLLELVFQHLELIEKDYFGLEFSDSGVAPSPANTDVVMRWLDPVKLVKKQQRGGNFYFRVKFYVSDPSKLQEEYTRYHFYLQIRRDILQGRLELPPSSACLLASYSVQSELGDHSPEEHGPHYLSSLSLVPGQTEEMERKICELHKLHRGQTPADAEFTYLDHAKRLDMYGVDLHRARDNSGKEFQLGVCSTGLVIIKNAIRINTFSWSKIVKISFKQKQFFIQLRRELSEDYDTNLGFNLLTYRSSKSLWKSCVEHHTFFRLHSPHISHRRFHLSLGSRFTYSGRTEFQTVEDGRQRARLERTFIRSPSKRVSRQGAGGAAPVPATGLPVPDEKGAKQQGVVGAAAPVPPRPPRPSYDNKVTSLGSREPRRAWADPAQPSDDEGGFAEQQQRAGAHPPFSRALAYADADEPGEAALAPQEPPAYQEADLVVIRMLPDDQGRFGFNVKGGADLNHPILVSRVAPNTPADRSYPRLNEGDQVVAIDGRDVAGLSHEAVVGLIRASRDSPAGELVLAVRPDAVYEAREEGEEPPYQYVPDLPHAPGAGADALQESMLLLADELYGVKHTLSFSVRQGGGEGAGRPEVLGLASGALVAQFEQLYRKKPGLTTVEAKKNNGKNRYRDISPYDSTRVVLAGGATGDYINANYVNMEIPSSGIVNRYIATQGPLPNTVSDFWQMVREAQSTLVVMLTPLVERGRAKCHKYWPAPGEHADLAPAGLRLSCLREEADPSHSFVFREFRLTHVETEEERHITHMQYVAWPDHGVPEDSAQFVAFTERVRLARVGMTEPTVVHCSAGIGRTGVLILMETAMCLVEANQPVYPLDIVRAMRDQRAMMIQTAVQYRFVCESVHRAYAEGVVKPLPEFQR